MYFHNQDITSSDKEYMRGELYDAVHSLLTTQDERQEWERRDYHDLQIGIPRSGDLRVVLRHMIEREHDGDIFNARTADSVVIKDINIVNSCLQHVSDEVRSLIACHINYSYRRRVPSRKRKPKIAEFIEAVEQGTINSPIAQEATSDSKERLPADMSQESYVPLYKKIRSLVEQDDQIILSFLQPASLRISPVYSNERATTRLVMQAYRDQCSLLPAMRTRVRIWLQENNITTSGMTHYEFNARAVNALVAGDRAALAFALDNVWSQIMANQYEEGFITLDELTNLEEEITFHTNNIRRGKVAF
jgi:hypothetical protein